MLALVHELADRAVMDMEGALIACESPIEAAMLFALTIAAGRFLGDWEDDTRLISLPLVSVGSPTRGTHRVFNRIGWGYVLIEPQAKIDAYRADFLVTAQWNRPPSNSRERLFLKRKLIVECDGHAFHDRTKEQASRDRERDRALQVAGYRVFRYTGADIWADVFKCATEAIEFVAYPDATSEVTS